MSTDMLIMPMALMPRIPFGQWVTTVIDWMNNNLQGLFTLITDVIEFLVENLANLLMSAPVVLLVVLFGVLALVSRGWKLAIGGVLGFLLIDALGSWAPAMETLALVLVASVVALAIALPLGILAARSQGLSNAVRPLLDFMQTLPAFVYLLPALFFFGLGPAAGVFATIIFAMPPGVRLTELGIRQVDSEVVEAGRAFGAKPSAVLRGIQVPLALPTIMAGVNQVIMLALSMVVIASMVGSGGLGIPVLSALSTLKVGPGAEAGLAVVILAIYLDRVTAGFGQERKPLFSGLRDALSRRRQTTDASAPAAA